MSDIYSFGTWVRRRRKGLDLTQNALAERVGCTESMLRKIEADARRPSKQLAIRLASALELSGSQQAAFLKAARAELASDQLVHPLHEYSTTRTPATSKPAQSSQADLEIPRTAQQTSRVLAPVGTQVSTIPLPLNSLIDRTQELEQLLTLLRAGKRLLTLTGPGGVGKTRLIIQLATRLVAEYPDNIWFVDLSAVQDVAQLLVQVAQVVGGIEHETYDLAERLQLWLRGKHTLLLLDNAEQISHVADVFGQWLHNAPALTLVVASRIPLRLAGEQEYPIRPLAYPDPKATLTFEQIAEHSAVALFISRTQDLLPHFALTSANMADVVEICAQLDGLPLAIELAAARMRLFTPHQLLLQLREHGILQLLSSDSYDRPARQQTIQATLAWSYKLLSEPEQILFTRLSVFVSGWSLSVAEAVCADTKAATAQIRGEDFLKLLEGLIEHNLVQRSYEESVEARFTLLKSIREFAQQQLQLRGEQELLQGRHAELYIALVSQARERYDHGDVNAFAPIHADIDNLRSALDWALNHGMVAATAEAIVRLGPFWSSRMPVTLRWLEGVLAHGQELAPALHANILSLTGSLSWEVFRNPLRAQQLCAASVAIYRDIQDQRGLATALNRLAHIAVSMGVIDPAKTRAYLDESLALRRSIGDQSGSAETLIIQGHLAVLQGDFAHASACMNEALVLRRTRAAPLGIAVALFYVGWLAFKQGDYAHMEHVNSERLTIEQAMGNPQGIADCKLWLGVAILWQGDSAQALKLISESLVQLRNLDEPRNLTHVLDACTHTRMSTGDLNGAQRGQLERLTLLESLGVWRGAAWSHMLLGRIALAQSQPSEARSRFRTAYSILREGRAPYHPTHLFSDLSPRRDAEGLILLLEGSAALAAHTANAPMAVQLLGAAAQLRQSQHLHFYFPDEQQLTTETLASISQLLGQESFTTSWEAGQQMSLEQAVAYAFAHT